MCVPSGRVIFFFFPSSFKDPRFKSSLFLFFFFFFFFFLFFFFFFSSSVIRNNPRRQPFDRSCLCIYLEEEEEEEEKKKKKKKKNKRLKFFWRQNLSVKSLLFSSKNDFSFHDISRGLLICPLCGFPLNKKKTNGKGDIIFSNLFHFLSCKPRKPWRKNLGEKKKGHSSSAGVV